MKRLKWIITGGVQGVGFRPFVYKTALQAQVTGHVANTAQGVCLEIQGPPENLRRFEDIFATSLPPLAHISTWKREDVAPQADEETFQIKKSSGGASHQVLISPDVATCDDCLEDMRDPAGRRYQYAFTNCTNCGPRYTITASIPYDRPSTSMACFPLCPDCAREYANPLDRRFHAQPNACPVCGPRLWLTDNQGQFLAEQGAAIAQAATALRAGHILAMKGLGGFHLVCDAKNAQAVDRLRQRKKRQDKPLAIMVRDMAAAKRLCHLSAAEEALLNDRARPIVLLQGKNNTGLAAGLSPDSKYLGLMLPYTPLHHVLFTNLPDTPPEPTALVMTSGNASSEPLCLGNREALRRLALIADFFLLHDRDILIRCDDSVVRVVGEKPFFLRRARGYAPAPVDLATDGPTVLGVGPLLKNTLCLTKGKQAFVSQHIGDLDNLESLGFFQEMNAHLTDILRVQPVAVVHDLHPDFMSTHFAQKSGLPCLPLQHHFAHIHAVLGENGHLGAAIGLALDGTGLGTDKTIWGGEALFVNTAPLEHKRLAHFSPVMLPGGDAATREPWRIARAYLFALGINVVETKPWPWLAEHANADQIVGQMLMRRFNSPLTSSCGRLFDAVSAMLGICTRISYEGQAAIRLEAIQDKSETRAFSCPLKEKTDGLELDTIHLFAQVHAAWQAGDNPAAISRRFHLGLIDGLGELASRLCTQHECSTVALSGGVMLNLTLAQRLPKALAAKGLHVLTHRFLPPGDACISFGQCAYGRLKLTTDPRAS